MNPGLIGSTLSMLAFKHGISKNWAAQLLKGFSPSL
jgi:hypothetical protein